MKRLSIPEVLAVLPLAWGCSSDASRDAGPQRDVMSDEVVDVEGDLADAPETVCEGRRGADGRISCPEGVFGVTFCVRVPCAADDGGTSVAACCALG